MENIVLIPENRKIKIVTLLPIFLFLIAGVTQMIESGTALAHDKKKTFDIRPIPGSYNKTVIPGEKNTLHFDVYNTGDIPLTNIRFSAELPDGWKTEEEPEIINHLNARSTSTVSLTFAPPRNAGRDRYQVTIIGNADDIKRVARIYVKIDTTTSVWTWIGAAIVLFMIACFILIFKRYNRCEPVNF